MELFKNANYDFLGKKWPFIILSAILIIAGTVSLIAKGGPRYGIDFRGGAHVYLKFAEKPPVEKIRSVLAAKLPGGTPEVQEVTGENEVIVGTELRDERELEQARRTILDALAANFGAGESGKLDLNNASVQAIADRLRGPLMQKGISLDEQQLQAAASAITRFRDTPPRSGLIRSFDQLTGLPGVTPQILETLKQEATLAQYSVRNVEIVGPKVGGEMRRQAMYVVLAALAGMLIYIAFRFEWIYGVAAVLAVFHDVIVTVGIFSVLDKEISLTVVASLLTLVGFSMNDTIVVFDRIRENLKLNKRMPYEQLVNMSINQTLSRTILTSGLTFLTALSLWLFGGPVLNGFSLALVIGIIVGSYSSIYFASPVLIFWHEWREKRKKRRPAAPAAPAGGGAVKPRTPVRAAK
jgi:preprotein translocase subunit SecF